MKSSILQVVSCAALLALVALMGLVAKGTIQKPGATSAGDVVRSASLLRDRALKSISYAGNNGRPGGAFPLGICEGDCDSDSDCAGSLRCFQRNGGQSVPGCDGGASDSSRSDFCYDPNGGGGGGPSPTPPSPTPPSPSPPSPTPPASGRFNLKLYWEEGYFWQEERIERKWCMQCRGGCRIGKDLKIVDCDGGRRGNPDNFRFIQHSGGEIQIQEDSSELCFQRSGRDISLQRCNSGNSNQRWVATSGGFGGRRFQISPKGRRGDCVTQRHHPKDGEIVEIEPCATAQKGDTSFWNRA
jgi:hypothetical protein